MSPLKFNKPLIRLAAGLLALCVLASAVVAAPSAPTCLLYTSRSGAPDDVG